MLLVLAVGGGAAPAAPSRSTPAVARPPTTSAPGPDSAPLEMRIAAVVNDEVISAEDLASRIRMVELSTNIPDSPEVRQRLAPQVLRTMVDEKLQMQEAKKQHVSATDEELRKALTSIEKQNNMQEGQLNQFLKSRGIDRGTLVDQVTASLLWAKLVRRLASETSPVSDGEVDEAMKRLEAQKNEPEMRVAEIFLGVDKPGQDAEVLQLAQKLTEQMRQGARFSAVAQQFSQSATAAVGGDLGWLRPGQLAPELAKAAASMKPGELSAPIRTNAGYYLLLVLDRRGVGAASDEDEVLHVVQVVVPLPADASPVLRNAAAQQIAAMREAGKSCPELLKIGKEKFPQLSSEGEMRVGAIAPALRALLLKTPIGQPTQPILQKNGVGVIMVCDKSKPEAARSLTRNEVEESLMRQKLDALARRYMEDLRRAAYVDVRV